MVMHFFEDERALSARAAALTGSTVKLRLLDSTELTGTLTSLGDSGRVITLTATTTVWTIPLSRVLAIANG